MQSKNKPAPTKAEAEALFAKTVSALGVKSNDLILDSYADEWSASVTGYLKIDGVRSPLSWSIGYGADAAITWAMAARTAWNWW